MRFLKSECVRQRTIALVLTVTMFIPFLQVSAVEKLECGKDWISNGLIKLTVSETTKIPHKYKCLVACALKNADGEWTRRLFVRDNGSGETSFHDEAHEEVKAKVEKDRFAEITFKKVDRKPYKNRGGKKAWKKYKILIFPDSYEIKIKCTASSDTTKCNWYIMGGNTCEYLMTEAGIKDAADCKAGYASVKVGNPAYGVVWGINSGFFYMVHWEGMKKAVVWRNKTNETWPHFIVWNIDRPLSVYLHPTKKMITDREIKDICGKML